MNGETILIAANAEWDWETRVNCHHIASRLARQNRVLFVDTIGGRTPAPRELAKVLRRLKRIAGGVRRIDEGLTVLSPFVLPLYGNERVRELNTALLTWQMKRALPTTSRPILWIFLPSLVGLVGRFDEKLVIYHCIDQHAANPNVPAALVSTWERQLLQRADVVLASSSTLFEAKRKLNARTHYLPNVGDDAHFGKACDADLPVADDVKDIPHPIAGFIGNITAYKLDLPLIAAVAAERPAWSFVLIGPVGRGDPSTDIARLAELPNIRLLGPRPYADLPGYVKAFDVCLIPFQQNESTRGTLPMKFFEYLAAGKPVVATDLPALAEFQGQFRVARTAPEFAAALDAALAEGAECGEARARFASRYSWDARMQEIDVIVRDALASRC